MRLNYIKNYLEKIDFQELRLILKNEGNTYFLSNIQNFKILLEMLVEIEIYNEEISELKQTELYSSPQDTIHLSSQRRNEIFLISDYIIKSAQSLLRVFQKLVPPSSDQSVSIKLPEPTDFESLIKSMSNLQSKR